ncbi:MAG: hypothetical protein LBE27_02815 [Deltaproteobacteria bacterium]|jgi:hypothetical protein|nr:hypothetical protein [Deltaproteobacteria bacterium]
MTISLVIALSLMGQIFPPELPFGPGDLGYAARPNPYNIGNCFQYKNCLGESIGNMWFYNPDFCKPAGGKSWKNNIGKCYNLPDGPQPINPGDFVKLFSCPQLEAAKANDEAKKE